MSKSAASDSGVVWMLDDPAKTAKKIKSAVTDDDREIRFDRGAKPGVSNLLTILSAFTGTAVLALEESFAGKGYGDLKTTVADAVVATFEPMRARALALLDDPAELDRILGRNAERAAAIAEPKLQLVYDRIGLLRRP
jgi:tryptophanyl-tRNA synthetase